MLAGYFAVSNTKGTGIDRFRERIVKVNNGPPLKRGLSQQRHKRGIAAAPPIKWCFVIMCYKFSEIFLFLFFFFCACLLRVLVKDDMIVIF